LSKLFDSVIGIDYSENFIDHCNKFINDKYIEYECTLEGNLNQKLSVRIDPDVVSLIYLLFSILCIYVNLYFAIRILIDLNLKWVMRVIYEAI
jgi:hypothetical protein